MRSSITAFYNSVRNQRTFESSGELGRQVIDGLERAAAFVGKTVLTRRTVASAVRNAAAHYVPSTTESSDARQVLLIGGTGFIGRALVNALISAGHSVRLLARRPSLVSNMVDQGQNVNIIPGDIRNFDDVTRAVQGCKVVIHLVAGAPKTWLEYEELYVHGTRNVAEACVTHRVAQLLFASTIAVYYLGDRRVAITEATPLDNHPERRNMYTRAKIEAEELLANLHRTCGLPVTIFRPGVVIGAGGSLEHSGVGFWPSRTHCITWGKGDEPLPFVLVDDVAAAFVAAIGRLGLEGKSFNLVGGVRPTAIEYIELLRKHSNRRIFVHRKGLLLWWAGNIFKWTVKKVSRRGKVPFPSYRDLASRTSASQFDCTLAKQVLSWSPVEDYDRFVSEGILQALDHQVQP
jgi:nucleoside-diphosphate-sugar epimerase